MLNVSAYFRLSLCNIAEKVLQCQTICLKLSFHIKDKWVHLSYQVGNCEILTAAFLMRAKCKFRSCGLTFLVNQNLAWQFANLKYVTEFNLTLVCQK